NTIRFIRTPQGITLTTEGEKFIQQSKLILTQYESLQKMQRSQDGTPDSFTLTSVRSSLVMETFLTLMNRYYEKSYFEFTLNESNGQRPIHDVTYYEADLGVIYTPGSVKSHLLKRLAQ